MSFVSPWAALAITVALAIFFALPNRNIRRLAALAPAHPAIETRT